MASIDSLYNSRSQDLNLLNKANIILIPKKEGAETIGDFRPISLIHDIAKIITKALALRLAPLINELISPCQSAFIKNAAYTIISYTCATSREDFTGQRHQPYFLKSTFRKLLTPSGGTTSSLSCNIEAFLSSGEIGSPPCLRPPLHRSC
jgi:hypothetical protein